MLRIRKKKVFFKVGASKKKTGKKRSRLVLNEFTWGFSDAFWRINEEGRYM